MAHLRHLEELLQRVHFMEQQVEQLSSVLTDDGEQGIDSTTILSLQKEIIRDLHCFKRELNDERVLRFNLELELSRERTRFHDLYEEMREERIRKSYEENEKLKKDTALLTQIDKLIQTVHIDHILKGTEIYKGEAVNMAIGTCNLEALRFIFSIGALDDSVNYNQALLFAVTLGYVGVIEYILHVGESMNVFRDLGNCLIMAAKNGMLEVSHILIEAGADVNHCDKDKETPLHAAARNGQCLVVVLLIQRNADISVKNKEGKTAYELATEGKHEDTAVYLR